MNGLEDLKLGKLTTELAITIKADIYSTLTNLTCAEMKLSIKYFNS